jgi:hypothetical protein
MVVLLLVGLFPGGLPAQKPDIPGLDEAARDYSYRLQAINAPAAYRQDELRPRYLQHLKRAEAMAKASGKLETVLLLQAETARFLKDPSFRSRKETGLDPVLLALRKPYQEMLSRLHDAAEPERAAAAQVYTAKLGILVKGLTQADRIEDAQYVHDLVRRIGTITGERRYHPLLYPGKARRTLDPVALEAELAGSRWRLSWLRGPLPVSGLSYMEFYPGRIYRIVLGDGQVRRGKYRVDDHRNVDLEDGDDLYFDPSFSAFNLHVGADGARRRGLYERSIFNRPADDNFLADLLVYYSFDEVGRQVVDKSPHGHHGTGFDTMTSWAGKRKNAVYFAGRSRVELEGKIDPDDYPEFSVALWCKVTGLFGGAILFQWAAEEENSGTYLKMSRGTFYYSFGTGRKDYVFSPRDFRYARDEWYHLVVTHQRLGGNALYVNGKRVESHLAYPMKGNSRRLSIGSKVDLPEDEKDLEFIGLMDDLMIFKRTLLPAEIATLYAWGDVD